MDPLPFKPPQTPTLLQKMTYYLLAGLLLISGIYYLAQGIAAFR